MRNHWLMREAARLVQDSLKITWTLYKILIPVLLIVKLLSEFGVIRAISPLLSPLMILVGLPGEMVLVWLTTMVSGIYGGLVVFASLSLNTPMTVAQVSVLGGMMLIAHSLPVEGEIARRVGFSWRWTFLLRVGGCLLYGMLLHQFYCLSGWAEMPAQSWLQVTAQDSSWSGWFLAQGVMLLQIMGFIFFLVVLLRVLRALHVERVLAWVFAPFLRLLGISSAAIDIVLIGMTLGLGYGGGLLIREVDTGRFQRNDVFAVMCLLSLCHSLIEDTLLVLSMGADLSGIFWGRVLFTFIAVPLLVKWHRKISKSTYR